MPWPNRSSFPRVVMQVPGWIADRHADLAAGGRLLLLKLVEVRVVLVEEDSRVDEDVDRAIGPTKQR